MEQNDNSPSVKVTAVLHAKTVSLTETEYWITDIKNLPEELPNPFKLNFEQCRMIFFDNSPMQLFKKRMEADPMIDINYYGYFKMGMEEMLKRNHINKNSIPVEIISEPDTETNKLECHGCKAGLPRNIEGFHYNPGVSFKIPCLKKYNKLVLDENQCIQLKYLEQES